MNTFLVILLVWLILGVSCVIFTLWFMRTREQQLMDEIPEFQIFTCVPPPAKWAVIFIMLLFGPLVLLWSVWEAAREFRREEDERERRGEPPVPAAPVGPPPWWLQIVFFSLLGAAMSAWGWANECTPKPLSAFWESQAHIGAFLLLCVLGSVLAGKGLLHGLRFPFTMLPLYVLGLVPSVVSFTGEWEGGWLLGSLGAVAGAAGGAAMGWLFTRLGLSQPEKDLPSSRRRAIILPITFGVLLGLLGGYNWAIEWVPPDQAWWLLVVWLLLAIPGALVLRPVVGLAVMSPFIGVILVPTVASMTLGWEGGWIAGIAGAVIGTTGGAMSGWLFNRWIMPEYDKRRERQNPAQNPSTPSIRS